MRTYTSYTTDIARVFNNSNADNITWGMELVNDSLRRLTTRYFWNEESVTLRTQSNVQFYPLPAQLDKLVNVTVLIGNVLWQPNECSSRQFWDALNVIQFYQDYPYYYFIYGGQIGLWPTPTTAGDIITINYKSRIVDLTMADVTDQNTGYTLQATNGSTVLIASGSGTTPFVSWMAQSQNSGASLGQVTGIVAGTSGTTVYYTDLGDTQTNIQSGTEINFTSIGSYTGISAGTTAYYLGQVTPTTAAIYSDPQLQNVITISGSGTADFQVFYTEIANPAGSASALRIPFTSSNSTCGDNQWYPINTIINGTTAYLSMPYQGQSVSGAPFTIGQTPLLLEDYQDIPLYYAAMVYYTTRIPDPQKAQYYTAVYEKAYQQLDDTYSTKSTSVVLSDMNQPMVNPNLYIQKIT